MARRIHTPSQKKQDINAIQKETLYALRNEYQIMRLYTNNFLTIFSDQWKDEI